MPNRADRRRMARAATKGVGGKEDTSKPGGEFGIEVNYDDSHVWLTCLQGSAVFTIGWAKKDASIVVGMLQDAIDGGGDVKVADREVVRQSGLVVPPKGMQL